ASTACLSSSGFAGDARGADPDRTAPATGAEGRAGGAAGSAAAGGEVGVGSGWVAICLLPHHACPKPTGIVIGHSIKTATTRPSRTETIRDASSMTGPRSQNPEN